MTKTINFRIVVYPYDKIIDRIIDPIIKFIPGATRQLEYLEGGVNVSFFHETMPHKGVFMSHGIADKNWRDAPFIFDYEYICVSGPLWEQKMISQGIPKEKILVNGYTKLDALFEEKTAKKANSNGINLLFAPTYSGFSKVAIHHNFLNELNLPDDIKIIESIHPGNDRYSITYEQFKNTDVVISDCGSTLYEAWALGLPVIFPDWLVKDAILTEYADSFEDFIYTNEIGFHALDHKDLIEKIYEAKVLGIDDRTKEFMEGIFPSELRGRSGEVTAEMLLEIANK